MGESKPWELTAFMHVRTRERGDLGRQGERLSRRRDEARGDALLRCTRRPTFIHGTAIARSCLERGIQSLWQRSLGHWQRPWCVPRNE